MISSSINPTNPAGIILIMIYNANIFPELSSFEKIDFSISRMSFRKTTIVARAVAKWSNTVIKRLWSERLSLPRISLNISR